MTIQNNATAIHLTLLSVACMSLALFATGCTPNLSDDPIPYQPFGTISINLSLPEFNSLKTDGGFKYIDGGVRGIIIYRENSSSYKAFERNCSFHPNDACATVEVHGTTLFMLDPCCNSNFDFKGQPTSGPAWRNLRQYAISLDNFTLTITDDIL